MSARTRPSLNKTATLVALVVGVGAGSYGIANAASGSCDDHDAVRPPRLRRRPHPVQTARTPWGHQRSDETLLTGDALAKVTAIAEAKVPGGTIVRVETDADGVAAYEAHMTKADGSPVTVYVDSSFAFVSVQ